MSSSRLSVRGAALAASAVCMVLLGPAAPAFADFDDEPPPATSAPNPTTGPNGPALVTPTPTAAPTATPTPTAAPTATPAPTPPPTPTTTRFETAGCTTWVVPAGVRSIDAMAVGSGGYTHQQGTGGRGGRALTTLTVTAGQPLRICVFVGGGSGAGGNSGGGASGIALGTDFSTPVLIAGGGGGAGYATSSVSRYNGNGGDAGAPVAAAGAAGGGAQGGGGGTLTSGGDGANPGRATDASGPGTGGAASFRNSSAGEAFAFAAGGGGGGGYFGGGGGGSAITTTIVSGGGGGGGSSYCASTRSDVSACALSLEPGSGYGVGAGAGLAKVLLSYVVEDTTPPVVTPLIGGTKGDNDWYTSDVSVTWAVSDPDSSITTQAGCDETIVTADTAGTAITCTAESLGGTTTETVTIKRDTQAPTLGANDAPVDGETYTIDDLPGPPRCTAVDATSGVIANGCDLFGFSREPGEHTVTIRARDNAGNVATQRRTYTLIDATPPEITKTVNGTLGSNGWYTSNVGVTWSVDDPDFPVDSTSGCGPTVVDTDTTGLDITCSATSPGGESTKTVTIKLDTQAPLLSISGGPSDGGSYTLGSVPAAPQCSANDLTSGVDGDCVVDGYSAALGDHTITFSAKDKAGHEVTKTRTYAVSGSTVTISGVAPSTTAGASYAFAFTVGGDPAASVSLESGSLPPGITLSGDGQLSGSPSAAGTYRFKVKAENSVGSQASSQQTITVAPAAAAELVVTSGDAQSAAPGKAFAKPLLVLVTDIYGNPVGNQRVTFTVSSAAANLAGAASRTLTTKADGFVGATLNGKSTGTVRVTAALTGNASVPTVLFTESVRSTSSSKADLAVSITGLPPSLPVGATATVTVKVKNNGPNAASSVLTTLDPGPGVTVISATGGTIAPLGTAGQWTASTLASGATLSYTARIKVTSMPWCASARIRVATGSTTNDTALTNNAVGPVLRITDASAPS